MSEHTCPYCGVDENSDQVHTDECEWERFKNTLLRFAPRRDQSNLVHKSVQHERTAVE